MKSREPIGNAWCSEWKIPSRPVAWGHSLGPAIVFFSLARALGGCSEVDYVLGTASTETTAPDAGVGSGPFGPAEAVSELADATYGVSNPTFPEDMLELYFTTSRPGGPGSEDIWVARRASTGEPWGPSLPVIELGSPTTDSAIGISSDGLSMWISSDRPGGLGKMDIWMASRPNTQAAWSTPVNVPELSSPEDDMAHPAMSSPLLMLVASKRLNASDWDLFVARRASAETPQWETPTPFAEVNSTSSDVDPFLSREGQQLFFNSNRGDTGEDLYQSQKDPVTGRFSTPEPLVELNSGDNERDPWLSPDLRTLLFCSNREGSYQVYQARR